MTPLMFFTRKMKETQAQALFVCFAGRWKSPEAGGQKPEVDRRRERRGGQRKVLGIFKSTRGTGFGRVPPHRGSSTHGGRGKTGRDDRASSCFSLTRLTVTVEAETPTWMADPGVSSADGRDIKYFAPNWDAGEWGEGRPSGVDGLDYNVILGEVGVGKWASRDRTTCQGAIRINISCRR